MQQDPASPPGNACRNPESRPLRFLVDAMLGNVARDLRLLGFDAAYAGRRSDPELLRLCQRERRLLVTRDRGLAARAANVPCVLVNQDAPSGQTLEVLRELGIEPGQLKPFTRCIRCNGSLRRLAAREARQHLPDHVAHTPGPFRACDSCGRAYWPGNHVNRLAERVRRMAEALQAPLRTV